MENTCKKYKVRISTDGYQTVYLDYKEDVDTKNMNDFMKNINGWNTIEKGFNSIKWRIMMFLGLRDEEHQTSLSYKRWLSEKRNSLVFENNGKTCRLPIAPLGLKCGNISLSKILKILDKRDYVCIPFSDVYGYYVEGHMEQCFMEISRVYTYYEGRKSITKTKSDWMQWYRKYGDKNNFAGAEEWFYENLKMGLLN